MVKNSRTEDHALAADADQQSARQTDEIYKFDNPLLALLSKNLAFVIYFVAIFALTFTVLARCDYDYDLFHGTTLDKLWDFMKNRVENWSSRVFIDLICVLFTNCWLMFFAITNIAMYVLLEKSVYHTFGKKDQRIEFFVAMSILALQTPHMLGSAGWIATIINYVWPAAAFSYVVCICARALRRQKNPLVSKILLTPAALLAFDQEQMAAIGLGATITGVIYMAWRRIKNRRRGTKQKLYVPTAVIITSLIAVLSFLWVTVCPGNHARAEYTSLNPDYSIMSTGEKLAVGTNLGIYEAFEFVHLFYPAIAIILAILVFNTKSIKHFTLRLFLALPAMFAALLFTFEYLLKLDPYAYSLLENFFEQAAYPNHPTEQIVGIAIAVTIFIYIVLACYFISGRNKKVTVFLALVLLAGMLSRTIIGFAPSIYQSDERTAYFFELALVYLLSFLFIMNFDKMSRREIAAILTVMTIAALGSTVLFYFTDHSSLSEFNAEHDVE